MTTKVPAIPSPDLNHLKATKALKELAEVREGLRGDPLDRFVTIRELESLVINNEKLVQLLGAGHVHTHASLTGITSDDHHSQVHVLAGSDHTASGLTAGFVLRASAETAFAWAQLQHGDLGDVSADQHHSQTHGLVSADHTVAGLTAGHFLKALTPDTFGFAAHGLTFTDVGAAAAGHNHDGIYDPIGEAAAEVGGHEGAFNHANYDTSFGWGNHALAGYEPGLGNPAVTGYVLSSTDAGVRSWIALAAGHAAVTLDANADAFLSLNIQEIGLDDQGANLVFAGPAAGADDVPTFRSLVVADIPALSYEPALGNPDVDGKVLSSTAAGVRSWIAAGGGGGLFSEDANRNIIGGTNAGASLTTGFGNFFGGYEAGRYVTDTEYNVCIGYLAGKSTSGNTHGQNIFIGGLCGGYNSANTSSSCVGIGYLSLAVLTSGTYNIALGGSSGRDLTSGYRNTLLGYGAGNSLTTGFYNILIGYNVNAPAVDSEYIFRIGHGSIDYLHGNILYKQLALYAPDFYLNFNTTLGASGYGFRDNSGVMEWKDSGGSWYPFTNPTLTGATIGGNLTFSGDARRIIISSDMSDHDNRFAIQEGASNATTRLNIIASGTGSAALLNTYNQSSDLNNSSIGQFGCFSGGVYVAATRTGTGSFQPIIFQTSNTERMRITESGNVGIGTNPGSSYIFDVEAVGSSVGVRFFTSAATGHVAIGRTFSTSYKFIMRSLGNDSTTSACGMQDSSGTLLFRIRDDGYGYLAAASWAHSDIRSKDNISELPRHQTIAKILALQPIRYDMVRGPKNQVGFAAQDVAPVIPEAVMDWETRELPDGTWEKAPAICYQFIIPYLAGGVQEHQDMIDSLASRIEDLEAENITLHAKLAEIEHRSRN